MFTDPANVLNQLSVVPGLELELAATSLLAMGVVGYLARVAWISLSQARRIEFETRQRMERTSEELAIARPYCAG